MVEYSSHNNLRNLPHLKEKCIHLCGNITKKVQMVDCSKLGGDQCAVKYAKDAYYSYCNTKFNVSNRILNCYQIYDCEIFDNLGNTYKINCSLPKS